MTRNSLKGFMPACFALLAIASMAGCAATVVTEDEIATGEVSEAMDITVEYCDGVNDSPNCIWRIGGAIGVYQGPVSDADPDPAPSSSPYRPAIISTCSPYAYICEYN